MHSSRHATKRAGCTMRQLDYLVRTDLVHPHVGPNGIGSRMGWSDEDERVLAVFTMLRNLGATCEALAYLEDALRRLDEREWSDRFIVTRDGSLVGLTSRPGQYAAGWLIDLAAISMETAA